MIVTIGHSTRTTTEFIELLEGVGVDLLVDIRRFPGSRRHPHFGAAALEEALRGAGIAYRHEEALGGRRTPDPDSPNRALRNASFRAYADHMATPEFEVAVDRLLADGRTCAPAVMCAEAVPWRCHRWLLSDALLARGAEVRHLLAAGDVRPHTLNPAALVREARVRYPAPESPQRSMFPSEE